MRSPLFSGNICWQRSRMRRISLECREFPVFCDLGRHRLNKLTNEGPEVRSAIQQNLRGRRGDLCRILLDRSVHGQHRPTEHEAWSSSDRPVKLECTSVHTQNFQHHLSRATTEHRNDDLVKRTLDPLAKADDFRQKRGQCDNCGCYCYWFHRYWKD